MLGAYLHTNGDFMCLAENCDSKPIAKGFCDKHYRKFRKYGDPNFEVREMHGMKKTKPYRTWRHIKDRCFNENDIAYKHYGGRGITMCNEWVNSFTAFYNHVGDAPTSKHQLDRINNDGNYEPNNVRWVLPAVNSRNKRSTKLTVSDVLDIRESHDTVENIAKKFNVSESHVYRIRNNSTWLLIDE